jgi:hypothetical protein
MPMIELTPEQVKAIEQEENLSVVVNPKTREEFILIRKERFEAMQKWIAPLKRRWDDPADDNLTKKIMKSGYFSGDEGILPSC